MQQLASKNAPTPNLIIPHFIFGGISIFLVFFILTFFPDILTQHYFNQKLLATTHLLVLGFVSTIIFGALYQLIPVILETKLFNEKLGFLSFILFEIGNVLLVISFWNYWLNTIFHIAATLTILGVLIFVINIYFTCKNSSKTPIEKKFITTSSIWLFFTVVVGFILGLNLNNSFLPTPHLELLKLHSQSGFVGWFLLLIIGVGSKLIPMFMVSHNLNTKKLNYSYYLINIGLVTTIVSLGLQFSYLLIITVLIIAAGVVSFLSFIYEAYTKRIKKKLDIGMKQSFMAFIIMLVPLILINILTFFNVKGITNNPSTLVYGSAVIIGFTGSLIFGQTYKTLPFIIWLKVYKKLIGKQKIPFPKDLYSEKIALIQFWTYTIGFLLFVVAIYAKETQLITVGSLAMLISSLLYNINVFKIIYHKTKIIENE